MKEKNNGLDDGFMIENGKTVFDFKVEDQVIRFECPVRKKNKEQDKIIEDDQLSEESNEVVRYYMQKYGRKEKQKIEERKK